MGFNKELYALLDVMDGLLNGVRVHEAGGQNRHLSPPQAVFLLRDRDLYLIRSHLNLLCTQIVSP
jgi:hypothetical protein